jgi:WD40 repeat protein
VTCADDGSLRLCDLESGTQIGDDWQDKGTLGIVFSITLSPNGKTIASGSIDGIVRLWDVEKGKFIAQWTGHTLRVCSVRWSGDGERVASASSDGMLRVRHPETGKTLLGPIKTRHSRVYGVSYSPTNSKIATGGVHEGGRHAVSPANMVKR